MTDPTYTPVEVDGSTDPFVRRMVGQVNHSFQYFDVPFITEVLPGRLYHGGVENGLILPKEIQNVVSLYVWEQYTVQHELNSALLVRMHDSIKQGMSEVEAISDWVVGILARDESVLVHCQAGLNRSSLIVARVLMKLGEVDTGQEAIDLIREKRSQACFANPTFTKYIHGL